MKAQLGVRDRHPPKSPRHHLKNNSTTHTKPTRQKEDHSSPSRHKLRPLLRRFLDERSIATLVVSLSLFVSSFLYWPRARYALPIVHNDYSRHLQYLRFHSGVKAYDEAFVLALQETIDNIQEDGTFVAGAGWQQLWTRDTAYALQLSLALLYPQASQKTLQALTQEQNDNDMLHLGDISVRVGIKGKPDALESTVDDTRVYTTWFQDSCGHFGGWPNLSDAIVGALGAWSLYVATGDVEWLKWATPITQNTLKWAEADVLDAHNSGLFKGCSSFMESNSGYPTKYRNNGTLVGQTKALSTNMLYYWGYKVAADMRHELALKSTIAEDALLGEGVGALTSKANNLKQAIQSRLWMEQNGYYSYFEDEESKLAEQMEGLGGSLVLLAPEFELNQTRIRRIFQKTHRTPNGLPCLWPRFEGHWEWIGDDHYYHNGRIWPFVQGYWALAAARHGQVSVFEEELNNLIKLSGVGTEPEENQTFAEFYETNRTFLWKRRRQLWSSAGYLGMILQGLFGIELETSGIRFRPVKPKNIKQAIALENLPYRKASVTVHVSGHGSRVKSFSLNGKAKKEPFLPADAVGNQLVKIHLQDG